MSKPLIFKYFLRDMRKKWGGGGECVGTFDLIFLNR